MTQLIIKHYLLYNKVFLASNKLLINLSLKGCSNALDFVYHTTFDLYTLQSRVHLNTLYSAHYTRFDKSNRVQRCWTGQTSTRQPLDFSFVSRSLKRYSTKLSPFERTTQLIEHFTACEHAQLKSTKSHKWVILTHSFVILVEWLYSPCIACALNRPL